MKRKWKQLTALLLALALCLGMLPSAAYASESDVMPASDSDGPISLYDVEWGQVHAVANETVEGTCNVYNRDLLGFSGRIYFAVQVDEPGQLEIVLGSAIYDHSLYMWDNSTQGWSGVSGAGEFVLDIEEAGVYYFLSQLQLPGYTRTIYVTLYTEDKEEELPEEGDYSIHVVSSQEDYSFPTKSTMELAFTLYCDGEPVGLKAEQEYAYEIADLSLFDAIDEAPLRSDDGTTAGTVGLALSLRSGSTAGTTTLTVTEVHTGAQAQLKLQTYVEGYSLNVKASNAACSVDIGDELLLSFELLCNGKPVGFNSTQISFSWEDGAAESDIFAYKGEAVLENSEPTEDWMNWRSYAFEAKAAGNAVLTVTAQERYKGESISIRLHLTAYDDSAYTRFNEVPVVNTTDGIQTNYYNVDGLYIEEFNYHETGEDNYKVDFNVYNTLTLYGAVTVYDKDGTIIDVVKINPFKNFPESWYGYSEEDGVNSEILEFMWNRYTYFADCLTDSTADIYGYRNSSMAQKTKVSVTVPQDGYITISTDMCMEPAVWIYNTFSLMMNFSKLASETIKLNNTDIDKVIDGAVEKTLLNMPIKFTENLVKKIVRRYEDKVENVYVDSSFYDDFDIHAEIISILGEEEYKELLTELLDDVGVSVSYDALLSVLSQGTMAKLMLDMTASVMKVTNIASFAIDYSKAITRNTGATTTLYTPLDSSSGMTDVNKGVITIDDSAAKDTSVLDVEVEDDYAESFGGSFFIAEHSNSASSQAAIERIRAMLDSETSYLFAVYNLYFKDSNGEIIEVKGDKGDFTITMAIPDGLSADSLGVYRIESDGSPTLLDFTVDRSAGTVTFVTDHFSTYVFVSEAEDAGGNTGSAAVETGDNHATGLWLALMLLAALGLACTGLNRKRVWK